MKNYFLKITQHTLFYFFLFSFLIFPSYVFAQISITEIMYDAPGGDDGREWVEISNSGPTTVVLSALRLREAETNHKLAEFFGGATLPSGAYAIIANNPEKFKGDFPNFSGVLVDSSFSLSNAGETLSIRDGDINLDSVSYTTEWGAKGDGNSLQKINGEWKASSPTPGEANSLNTNSKVAPTQGENSSASDSSLDVWAESFPVESQIFAHAGKDKKAVAGQTLEFTGKAWGLKNEPLLNAKYGWTFGDGGQAFGIHVTHTFRHVGSYVVVLNVSSGEYSASNRLLVIVSEPQIFITQIKNETDGYVEILNLSSNELDLSFWGLKSGGKIFSFPSGTILLSKSKVRFVNSITGLDAESDTSLLFQNGNVAVKYVPSFPSSKISQTIDSSFISNPVIKKQESPSSAPPTKSFASDDMVEKQKASIDSSEISNFFSFGLEFLWLLILLILFAGGSLVFLRRNHENKTPNDSESFEIIEISDS